MFVYSREADVDMARAAMLATLFLIGCCATAPVKEQFAPGAIKSAPIQKAQIQTLQHAACPAPQTQETLTGGAASRTVAYFTSTEDDSTTPSLPQAAARGQQPVTESLSLTLANLEELALQHNPTISQAGSLVRQQEGVTIQAGLLPNPSVGYVRNDADKSGQTQSQGVFIGQEFVTAGKLRLAEEAGRYDITLRQEQLNAQQWRVVNDVRIRFYEVLGAQQALLAAEELQASADDGVKIARELLEARQGGRPDVLQAEMQRSLADGAVADAKFRWQAARRQLAIVVGANESELPAGDLAGSLNDQLPEWDYDACLNRLLELSPLLKSQAAELQAVHTEFHLARAQAVPNINVQVVAEHDRTQNFNSLSTFVALPVPLFNRNQGNIVSAEASCVQQHKEYERLQLALADQLAGSFRQFNSLRSERTRLQQDVLPRAEENLKLTTEAYRVGRMDFLRVVDARRTYFEAKLTEINTLTELRKTIVEIEGLQLTGGLNPTEVGTALQSTSGGGLGQRGVLLQQLQQQRGTSSRNLPGAIQAGE